MIGIILKKYIFFKKLFRSFLVDPSFFLLIFIALFTIWYGAFQSIYFFLHLKLEEGLS